MAICPYNKYLVVKHVSLFRECKCLYSKLIMIAKIRVYLYFFKEKFIQLLDIIFFSSSNISRLLK